MKCLSLFNTLASVEFKQFTIILMPCMINTATAEYIFCTLTLNIFLITLIHFYLELGYISTFTLVTVLEASMSTASKPEFPQNGKWMLFFAFDQPDLTCPNLTNPIKEGKEYKPIKIRVNRVMILIFLHKSHTGEFIQIIYVIRIGYNVTLSPQLLCNSTSGSSQLSVGLLTL